MTRPRGVYRSHLLPLELSRALFPTVFNEFWIVLDLSFDLLLQALDLFADGLYGRLVYQLGSVWRHSDLYVQRPFRTPDRDLQLRYGAEGDR